MNQRAPSIDLKYISRVVRESSEVALFTSEVFSVSNGVIYWSSRVVMGPSKAF